MSAAATAAGYLYASGRLRGRGQREEQESEHGEKAVPAKEQRRPKVATLRKEVRVAALPSAGEPAAGDRPRRQPTIQYRTRRWKPGANGE